MSVTSLDVLLRSVRRNLAVVRVLWTAVLIISVVALFWLLGLPEKEGRGALALLIVGGLILWTAFLVRSVRLGREIQMGNMLMALGRLDDAEACLGRALGRFSLSARAKLLLLQQLAMLLFRRDRHPEAVVVCRELLRHRIGRIRSLWLNTRVMLADSLLLLGQVEEAYIAMRPVYDTPLTLADRMKLLPVQLRYELAANHSASAAGGLGEKVKIAELLDSQKAALVHALLAEACRRQGMPVQYALLAERARLYCDLADLAVRYPMIETVAAKEEGEMERPRDGEKAAGRLEGERRRGGERESGGGGGNLLE